MTTEVPSEHQIVAQLELGANNNNHIDISLSIFNQAGRYLDNVYEHNIEAFNGAVTLTEAKSTSTILVKLSELPTDASFLYFSVSCYADLSLHTFGIQKDVNVKINASGSDSDDEVKLNNFALSESVQDHDTVICGFLKRTSATHWTFDNSHNISKKLLSFGETFRFIHDMVGKQVITLNYSTNP